MLMLSGFRGMKAPSSGDLKWKKTRSEDSRKVENSKSEDMDEFGREIRQEAPKVSTVEVEKRPPSNFSQVIAIPTPTGPPKDKNQLAAQMLKVN
jgi:hypothetical protein